MYRIAITISLLIAMSSCSNELERAEFVSYVTNPKNGLRNDQNIGDFEISVMYEPVDYIIEREFRNDISKESVTDRKKELAEFEHFQFRIKLTKGGNILRYNENIYQNETSRINHFSFDAKRDFKIVSGNDTTYCRLAHYSRNYNLTPTIDLSLTFDKIEKTRNLQLVYQDQQFDIGKVKFMFKKEAFEDLPDLKL